MKKYILLAIPLLLPLIIMSHLMAWSGFSRKEVADLDVSEATPFSTLYFSPSKSTSEPPFNNVSEEEIVVQESLSIENDYSSEALSIPENTLSSVAIPTDEVLNNEERVPDFSSKFYSNSNTEPVFDSHEASESFSSYPLDDSSRECLFSEPPAEYQANWTPHSEIYFSDESTDKWNDVDPSDSPYVYENTSHFVNESIESPQVYTSFEKNPSNPAVPFSQSTGPNFYSSSSNPIFDDPSEVLNESRERGDVFFAPSGEVIDENPYYFSSGLTPSPVETIIQAPGVMPSYLTPPPIPQPISSPLGCNPKGVPLANVEFSPVPISPPSDVPPVIKTCISGDPYASYGSLERITRIHAQAMRKQHHLYWSSSRGLEKVPAHRIFLSYDHYQVRTIQEIRKLLVILVESYLEAINGVFSPELAHFPLTPADIDVEIHIDNFHGEFVDRQYVEWVEMRHGLVCYQAYNCLHSKFGYVRKERYDQALHFAELDFAEDLMEPNPEDEYYRELALPPPPPPPGRSRSALRSARVAS